MSRTYYYDNCCLIHRLDRFGCASATAGKDFEIDCNVSFIFPNNNIISSISNPLALRTYSYLSTVDYFFKVKARMQHQRSLVISNTPKNKAIGPMLLLFSSPSVSNVPATLCSTTRRGASGNLWSYSFQPFVASTLDMLQTGLCNLCRSKSKKH